MRYFNTAGPVRCNEHYFLPPLGRFDLGEVIKLIDRNSYFVLHAPRQTGKTSSLLALAEYLNKEGRYTCLYLNVEAAQGARESVDEGVRLILGEMASRARYHLNDHSLEEMWFDLWQKRKAGALNEILSLWSERNQKGVVILIDEIDSLVGDTLISVLRQIRSGYDKRPEQFPGSIILCGVRDVRDYRIHSSKTKEIITGGSAFNIKAKSLRLGDFSREEAEKLFSMHSEETGQVFEEGVMEVLWELTRGQPWLVNALGYEVCFEMEEGLDRSKPITVDMIHKGKESLISQRSTHIDQLGDKLNEPRVRSVIEPLITGTQKPGKMLEDDIQYAVDIGLIRRKPQLSVSNAIYREIIPRMLTETTQDVLPFQTKWYIAESGGIDMDKLLSAFQDFFREHSEHWVERFDYKEAGPQLLLQAFLQRIVNSGGRVEREYGLGRMRTDLLVLWEKPGGVQKIVIELKIKYGSLEKTIAHGLKQTFEYMDKCAAVEGHLVVFDRDQKGWDEKIFQREEKLKGAVIKIWGM